MGVLSFYLTKYSKIVRKRSPLLVEIHLFPSKILITMYLISLFSKKIPIFDPKSTIFPPSSKSD